MKRGQRLFRTEQQPSELPDFGQDELEIPGGGAGKQPTNDDAATKAAADKAAADKAAADKVAADKAEADRVAAEKTANDKVPDGGNDGGENQPEAITIGEDTFKLDKDGNAIDETGKVVKTKAEIDALVAEQEEENIPVVDVIIKKAGVKLLDEKGQPVKFEDTEDGLVQVGLALGKEFAKGEFEQLIKSDPEFEEFVEYKKTGGKLADFIQKKTESWKAFKLDETNDQQLINVVIADLMAAGYSEERAKQTAEMYKETKRLKEFGKEAYDRLVTAEDNEEKERVANFKKQQEEQNTMVLNHWKSVNEVITKGNIHGVVIPETDKKNFFEYLSKAVDNKGNSQRTIDRSKLPLEQLLQLDYLQFKGFNLSELIKTAVKSEKAKSLRDKVKQHQGGVSGGEGIDRSKYQRPDDVTITLENMGN